MQAEVSCATSRSEAPAEALPGLSNHLVVEHILSPVNKYFGDDPVDLARLCTVSPAMRDAVKASGLRFTQLKIHEARKLWCLSVLKRLHRRGSLSAGQRYQCEAAAGNGLLGELKLFGEKDTRWDKWTCAAAAEGGHLEILK